MRVAAIDAVIAELRSVHLELQQPLTWDGISAILAREGIPLLRLPLVHDAQVISCDGVSVIAVNSNGNPRRQTYYVTHEWGHVKLHFRDAGEIVYHTSACWPNDPREDDAEYFATRLMLGPQVDRVQSIEGTVTRHDDGPELGDGAPVVHKPRSRRRLPPTEQGSFPFAATNHPVGQPAEDHVRAVLKQNSPRLRAKLEARDRADRERIAATLDLRPRIEFTRDGKERKHYFVDRSGRRWRVWDMVSPNRKSTSLKNVPVEPPNNWAVERVFVAEDGTKRSYLFPFHESHALEPALLERQLDRAH